jgi:DNA-binding transcriptional regulator GbsR (MarR family)
MKPSIRHPRMNANLDPEIKELATSIGHFIEYWGFKSVQGRIWCYLYLSTRPLSSIEIGKLLKISAPLVTQSMKVLLEYDVIEMVEKGPNGVLRYQANPNLSEPIVKVLKSREREMLGRIESLSKKAGTHSRTQSRSGYEMDAERLEQLQAWIAFGSISLEMIMGLFAQRENAE